MKFCFECRQNKWSANLENSSLFFLKLFFFSTPFSLSSSPSFTLFFLSFFSTLSKIHFSSLFFYPYLLLFLSLSIFFFLYCSPSLSLSLSLSLSIYLSISLSLFSLYLSFSLNIYTPIFLFLTIYLPFLSLLYWSVLTEKRVYHRVSITFTRMQTLLHVRQPYHDWIRSLN